MSRIAISLLVVSFVYTYVNAGHDHHHHERKCEANAELKPCGELCQPTCEKPKEIFCTPANKDSCKNECRCKDGYVRHKGKCIKVKDCPKPPQKCPARESFNLCGRLKEPTCSNPKPEACKAEECNKHTQGCRCDKGYVRDVTKNRCIREKHCVKCGDNEQIGACARLCEGTCKNRDPAKCAAISCTGLGCQCKEGFYRNEESDKCVPEDQCPKKCGYGEIYAACGPTCEGRCKSPTLPEICTIIRCSKRECRCDLDRGFVRDEKTKKCVHKDKCPRHRCKLSVKGNWPP